MPGITNPAEEYFKDGLWGWVSTAWKKLVADTSGFLKINFAAQDIEVEVKQATPADLTPGVCGWDGDSWQKLPMLFGYSDRWAEAPTGEASGTGDANADTGNVGAGEVWVVQFAAAYHNAGVNKELIIFVRAGAIVIPVLSEPSAVSGVWYPVTIGAVLKEGDDVLATATAPGNGKLVLLRVCGYKMKIAE